MMTPPRNTTVPAPRSTKRQDYPLPTYEGMEDALNKEKKKEMRRKNKEKNRLKKEEKRLKKKRTTSE